MANYYSPYTYDHNTAHILEPVQGYDIVSFMNFWAEMDDSVHGAVPGTVMHRDKDSGKMKTGLEWDSMAQFLYAKQDSEDVLNSPVTANGQNITSIGTISYGGFNTAPFQNPFNKENKRYGNGISSNIGPVEFDKVTGAAQPIRFTPQTSAFTTFPGACGLELGSSEFARVDTDGAEIKYQYDDALTAPVAKGDDWKPEKVTKTVNGVETEVSATYDGTIPQNQFGGFLMKGTHYVNNICGILSQKPFRNENGTWMIRFWACHKPALKPETVTALAGEHTTVPTLTKEDVTALGLTLADLADVSDTAPENGQVLSATVTTEGEGAEAVTTVEWGPVTP